MILALRKGERVKSQPGISGKCPLCKEEVIPKCGDIKTWHFAHKAKKDCDSWAEGETSWHINWKNNFPEEWQEVVIGCHIADIKTPHKNNVIEFQNSPISPEEIIERENYYGNMVWVLNGDTLAKNIILRPKGNYNTFRWKWPPQSWFYSKKKIYIDLNNGEMFLIKKMYPKTPCGGWGVIIKKRDFISENE